MVLHVKAMAQYLTDEVEKMRDRDYTAIQIVKSVKGRPPGGYSKRLTYKGRTYTIGPDTPEQGCALWSAWAANFIRSSLDHPEEEVVLVPVPNSSAVFDGEGFRTFELAAQVAEAVGGNVQAYDELRWKEQKTPSSKGGSRLAYDLYPNLAFEQKGAAGADRILIDDVLTSGGHLQACAARLRENSLKVKGALVCGRTTHAQLTNPYNVPVEQLPDFDPKDPFGFGGISDDFEI